MRSILAFIILLSALTPAAADTEEFPGVEKLMSEEQYRAAGLDKLTPAEREALNDWLIGYTALEATVMLRTNEEVKEVEQTHEIRARIKAPFKGWTGETVFRLDNGQVWRQRLQGRMVYSGEDTEVVIKKNFMGFYKMTHLASGRSVGVSIVQ